MSQVPGKNLTLRCIDGDLLVHLYVFYTKCDMIKNALSKSWKQEEFIKIPFKTSVVELCTSVFYGEWSSKYYTIEMYNLFNFLSVDKEFTHYSKYSLEAELRYEKEKNDKNRVMKVSKYLGLTNKSMCMYCDDDVEYIHEGCGEIGICEKGFVNCPSKESMLLRAATIYENFKDNKELYNKSMSKLVNYVITSQILYEQRLSLRIYGIESDPNFYNAIGTVRKYSGARVIYKVTGYFPLLNKECDYYANGNATSFETLAQKYKWITYTDLKYSD